MAFLLTFSGGASATYKDAVRVARDSQLALSGATPLVIDGITLVDKDRVLLRGQTAPAENGIYVCSIAGGAYTLTRALDANNDKEVLPNMLVPVAQGTSNADKIFQLVSPNVAPIVLGTDALVFTDVLIGLANKADRDLANLLPTAINQSLLFGDDTSYNIGAAAASRPQTLYVKTAINLASLTASKVVGSDGSKNLISSSVLTTDMETSVSDTQAATNAATANTIVKRDLNSQITLKALNLDGATSGTLNIYPAATTTNYSVTLPAAQGAASTFLQNNGSGTLSWTAVPDELPLQTGNAEKVLSTNGTSPTWQYAGKGDGSFGNNVILGAGKGSVGNTRDNILISSSTNPYTTGTLNVCIGSVPGPANREYSVIIGQNVSVTNDLTHTIIGYGAGGCVSSTAIGYGTRAGTPGAYGGNNNTAIGHAATIYAGDNCVALGYNSYSANNNQVVIGAGSSSGGNSVTLGPKTGALNNVVVGAGSGYFRNTGDNNTVLGSGSFNSASLTTAASCVVVGQAAATAVTTATNLTTVGMNSCLQLTTGSENTVLGYYAGSTNSGSGITTGAQNVCIGARAALGSGTDSNATAVGFQAKAASSSVGVGAACYESSTYGTSVGAACANVSSTNTYTVRVGYAVGNTANPFGTYMGPIGGARSVFVGALTNGTRLGVGYVDNNDCIFIGYSAGSRSQSTSNELFIDNQDRSSYANQQTKSIIYGVMNATETSQRLSLNAQVKLSYGEKHASLHGQTGTANVITATVNNYYIGVDSSLAAKTVNLPAAATAGAGFVLVIKDEGGLAATNNIVVDANASETIDGATTQTIAANYGSLNLICSGTAWFIN